MFISESRVTRITGDILLKPLEKSINAAKTAVDLNEGEYMAIST